MPAPIRLILIAACAPIAIFALAGAIGAGAPTPAAASGIVQPARPPIHWSPDALRVLTAEIEASRHLGLDPDDYGIAALRDEMQGGPAAAGIDHLATAAALHFALDLTAGGPATPGRPSPPSAHEPAARAALQVQLALADTTGTLRAWFGRLRSAGQAG